MSSRLPQHREPEDCSRIGPAELSECATVHFCCILFISLPFAAFRRRQLCLLSAFRSLNDEAVVSAAYLKATLPELPPKPPKPPWQEIALSPGFWAIVVCPFSTLRPF